MILLLFMLLSSLSAQDGAPVNLTTGPSPEPGYQRILFYSGTNLTYICKARQISPQSSLTVSGITAANPGVFTSAGHGFDLGSSPMVTITISGNNASWDSVAGTWILSPADANTFTIRNVGTGTQLNTSSGTGTIGTVTVRTSAPRLTNSHWSIDKYTYDGSNNLIGIFQAHGPGGKSGLKCSDRAATFVEWR